MNYVPRTAVDRYLTVALAKPISRCPSCARTPNFLIGLTDRTAVCGNGHRWKENLR